VKGFAFTLGLSTILDLVVVFMFTHPLIAVLSRSATLHLTAVSRDSVRSGRSPPSPRLRRPGKEFAIMSLFGRMYRGEVNIDFVGKRRRW